MKKSHIIELILFIIFVTMFGTFGVKAFKNTFDIGTTYHLAFNDIYGIEIGSPVRILGVDIGHVTKIQENYDEIYVDFIVSNPDVVLPEGTHATIEFFGIAGSRSIELTPPNGNVEAQGILVHDPIRIGDAIDIMGKFAKVMMVSIGGAYEFAKNRTLQEVEASTAAFVTTTNNADNRVEGVTASIKNIHHNLHKSFAGTQKGMDRVYEHAEGLNVTENFNRGQYLTNLTKRYLLKAHRNLKKANKYTLHCSNSADFMCKQVQNVNEKIEQIDKIYEAFKGVETAMKEFDSNLSQENLDKVYDKVEELRLQSEELKESI